MNFNDDDIIIFNNSKSQLQPIIEEPIIEEPLVEELIIEQPNNDDNITGLNDDVQPYFRYFDNIKPQTNDFTLVEDLFSAELDGIEDERDCDSECAFDCDITSSSGVGT
jgi:hypothetical protein